MAPVNFVKSTSIKAVDVNIPVHILGMGRYLPSVIVSNADIESETGIPSAMIEKYLGVQKRRRCDPANNERASTIGAKAVIDACKNAGISVSELDLIINASGSQERILPDIGPYIQKELGLSSAGIPCFSVHATCLSFVVGMNVAANLLQSGQYRKIVVVSAENPAPEFFEKNNMHTYPLFGSLAVAAIFTLPPENVQCGITRYYMETFGDLSEYCTVKSGTSFNPYREGADPTDICFKMDGPNLLLFIKENSMDLLEKIQPGLARGKLGDLKQIIPHQASGNGIKLLEMTFGKENVVTETFARFGNTLAASIPNALFEAIESGRVKRGDPILLIGTGAGVSVAALKFTY